MTLIVHLYGGPGTGKSTIAAGAYSKLKADGINAELVTEVAKDLTWEGRTEALQCQPYIIGQQLWRLKRLQGKVDVVITDTSILLALIYGEPTTATRDYVLEQYRKLDTLDFFLRRLDRPYQPAGRSQGEEEARLIDGDIRSMLIANDIGFGVCDSRTAEDASRLLSEWITRDLRPGNDR